MKAKLILPTWSWTSMLPCFFCLVMLSTVEHSAAQDMRDLLLEGNKEYFDGNFTNAENRYRRAGKVDSVTTSPIVPFNLGGALFQQERYREAIEQFSEVVAHPDASVEQRAAAWHNQGNAHAGLEDYAKAVNAYKQALRLNPADFDTKHNLAWAQEKLREQQENQEQQDQNQDDQEGEDGEEQDQEENQQQDGQQQDGEQQDGQQQDGQQQDGEQQDGQQQDGEQQDGEQQDGQQQDGQQQDGEQQDGQQQDGQQQDGQQQDGEQQDGQQQDGQQQDGQQQDGQQQDGEQQDGEQQDGQQQDGEQQDGEQQDGQQQDGEQQDGQQQDGEQQDGQSAGQSGTDEAEQDKQNAPSRVITISREDALRMLQALENQEKTLQKKMRRSSGKPRKTEKDW